MPQTFCGKPRLMPPWLGSSQRVVTTLPRVKKLTPSTPWAWVSPNSERLPAAEGVVRHRHRDRDVDPDHADLDLVGELPRRPAVVGEDRHPVAVRVVVDQLHALVVALHPHHRQHRPEDLVGVDAHVRRRPDRTVSARRRTRPRPRPPPAAARPPPAAAPAASPGVDVTRHPVPGLRSHQRAHVAAAGPVAGPQADRARSSIFSTSVSPISPDGQHRRDRHAALPGRPEAGVHGLVGGQIQIGIGQHQHVVLRPAERLHPLAVRGAVS